jgi:hypothetical protein
MSRIGAALPVDDEPWCVWCMPPDGWLMSIPGIAAALPLGGTGDVPLPAALGDGLPISMSGIDIDMPCIAAMRFVSESIRNCAEVTTRSPSVMPEMTG